jgi:hypothetical protein
MSAKRGLGVIVFAFFFLLIVAIFSTVPSINAATGLECYLNTQNTLDRCSGVSIYTPGYGAVEICEVCFHCGEDDNVCPEHFSDGEMESNPELLTMPMRVRRDTYSPELNKYSIMFNTGNLACMNISGDCGHIERSSNNINWVIDARGCALDVGLDSSSLDHFRAICINTPRRAGCYNCPDPNCKTILTGIAYDDVTRNRMDNVEVRITSSNNSNLLPITTTTDYQGNYTMYDAVTGYVDIACSKNGYTGISRTVLLKPGKNVFDCPMTNRTINCSPLCYIDDGSGQRLCSAECDGINGCNITEQAKIECDGKRFNTTLFLNATQATDLIYSCIYENVTSLVCCAGDYKYHNNTVFAPGGCSPTEPPTILSDYLSIDGNVSNMLTRNYKKEMNGRSLTLSIRTYTK